MGNDLQGRIKRVAGSQKRWAAATGMSAENVTRILKGKYPVPEWWEAMLELLEALPPKDWPERWTEADHKRTRR
jgi:lambda repressor-like predicted transcriptional regulator